MLHFLGSSIHPRVQLWASGPDAQDCIISSFYIIVCNAELSSIQLLLYVIPALTLSLQLLYVYVCTFIYVSKVLVDFKQSADRYEYFIMVVRYIKV